jgi:hypothetical protein
MRCLCGEFRSNYNYYKYVNANYIDPKLDLFLVSEP